MRHPEQFAVLHTYPAPKRGKPAPASVRAPFSTLEAAAQVGAALKAEHPTTTVLVARIEAELSEADAAYQLKRLRAEKGKA